MSADANESVNPYASPSGLEDRFERDPHRLLTATFYVDETWQRTASRLLTARQQDINSYVALAIIVAGALGGAAASHSYFVPDLLAGLIMGAMIAVLVGLIPLIAVVSPISSAWNRRFRPCEWPCGEVRLELSEAELTLAGHGFQQTFAIRQLRQLTFPKQVTFHVLGSDVRFHVPSTADFGDDDFPSWSKAIAARIK